jgi:hypothetical protein
MRQYEDLSMWHELEARELAKSIGGIVPPSGQPIERPYPMQIPPPPEPPVVSPGPAAAPGLTASILGPLPPPPNPFPPCPDPYPPAQYPVAPFSAQ